MNAYSALFFHQGATVKYFWGDTLFLFAMLPIPSLRFAFHLDATVKAFYVHVLFFDQGAAVKSF